MFFISLSKETIQLLFSELIAAFFTGCKPVLSLAVFKRVLFHTGNHNQHCVLFHILSRSAGCGLTDSVPRDWAFSKFAMFVLDRVDNLPELETKSSKWRYPEGRVLRHHPKLNTYTLTLEDVPGSPQPSLQSDVEELQRLMQSHQKVSQ